MRAARLRGLVASTALAVALAGCGYTFQGAQKALPGGATTIAIPILANPTLEPELASILTASIRDQFARTQAIRLVRTEAAEAILRGRVVGFSVDTVAFDAQGLALEYRATLTLSLTLTDPDGARIFWADPAVRGTDTYRAASDPLVTEANRREAVRRIAADIGRSVRDRVLAGF
ncbi:MAG TPA: LPS assembly lipoprotein LptE [Thermodesulfobacteriota bacterium]